MTELKTQHDVNLQAAWAKINLVRKHHDEIVAAALFRLKTNIDTYSQAIAEKLGLQYFSIDYGSKEDHRIRDACCKKAYEIKVPLIRTAHAALRAHEDLNYLIRHQFLPLLSLSHLFNRLQDEEQGIIWAEGLNLKDLFLQTDNQPLKQLISETTFSNITSHVFIEKIKELFSDDVDNPFAAHAFITIRQYNQALLAYYALPEYKITESDLSSAWVNDAFRSYPLDQITQKHTAIYEAERRQADLEHDAAIQPFCDEIGRIESQYVGALLALLPKPELNGDEKKGLVNRIEKQAKTVANNAIAAAIEGIPHAKLSKEKPRVPQQHLELKRAVAFSTVKNNTQPPLPTLFKPKALSFRIDYDYETLVFNLDYDGCTHTLEGQNTVIDCIVKTALENPLCQNVILCSASLRQSLSLELLNAIEKQYKNVKGRQWISSAEELKDITTRVYLRLQEEYQTLGKKPPTVALNPIHTFDVYNQLPIHTTHKKMTAEHYQRLFEASKVEDTEVWADNEQGQPVCLLSWLKDRPMISSVATSISCQDTHKILTHYMLAHDHALHFTGKTKITFFDNIRSNLTVSQNMYVSHPQLLPKNCHFQGLELVSSEKQVQFGVFKTAVVQGTGEANPEYRADLREIAIKYQSKETSASSLINELLERDPLPFQAELRGLIQDIHRASFNARAHNNKNVESLAKSAEMRSTELDLTPLDLIKTPPSIYHRFFAPLLDASPPSQLMASYSI